VAGVANDVIGREAELATIDSTLRGALPAAVVLEGEAGIGKTTVWRVACERAADVGLRVLRTSAAEAEASIAFASLSDLFADDVMRLGSQLEPVQRDALRLALGFTSAGEQQPLAVGLGARALLRTLADEQPTVIAIDDAQWLDSASAAALSFALRRVEDDRVLLLIARRTGGERGVEIERGFPRTTHVALRGFSFGVIGRIVAGRLGVAFKRPTIHRIHETSGGNPFYALELARVVSAEGERADGSIVVPASLREVLRNRLEGLSPETRDALSVLAGLAAADDELVTTLGISAALDAAVRAGVVFRDGAHVGFAHPLFRAMVLSELGEGRTRALHRRLADGTRGEERAWHLALGLTDPDEAAAGEIAAVAEAARDRGASREAAELARNALRLTDAGSPSRAQRAVLAGESLWAAGHYEGGRELMVDVFEDLPPGRERLELALALLASPRDIPGDLELVDAALAHADSFPDLESGLRHRRALLVWASGDVDASYAEIERARECAHSAGDRAAEVVAAGFREALDIATMRSTKIDALERAAELEEAQGRFTEMGSALMLGQCLFALDRLPESAAWYERVARDVIRRGDPMAVNVLESRAAIAFRLGDADAALRLFTESIELAREVGVENFEAGAYSRRGIIHAVRGDAEAAEADFAESQRLRDESGDATSRMHALRGRLLLALTLGDEELGVATAREALALAAHPAVGFTVDAEVAEVLIAVGQLDEAEQLVLNVEEEDQSTPRRVLEAALVRAAFEAAHGRLDEAAQAAERGVEAAAAGAAAFDEARMLLLAGAISRRRRDRQRARELLAAARERFERFGSEPWLAKVDGELARIPGRTPRIAGALTAAERRVAALAAAGRSNKQIAAELFVSTKTVEGHLRNIFEKLGVQRRAELAGLLAKDEGNHP
jgi:DNA-binding CsgD family transcriptional regulator